MFLTNVVITEVLGAGSTQSSPRGAVLVGPAMPFKGAPWSGEMNLTTTWYPGNGDDASQAVLGPKEMPSAWNGEWNKTRLYKTPATIVDEDGRETTVDEPFVLMQFLEDLFRSGRRLRVVWNTQQSPSAVGDGTVSANGSIVREGRAKQWSFKPSTYWDIEWDVTFEWAGRGVAQAKVASTRDDTVTTMSDAYLAKLRALVDANAFAADAKNFPNRLTIGQLEQLANLPAKVNAAISRQALQLQSELNQIQALARKVGQPFQVTHQSIRHARNVQDQAGAARQTLSAVPAEVTSTQSDAVSVLRAFRQFSLTQDAALEAADAAYVFGQSIRSSAATHSVPLSGEQVSDQNPDPRTIQTAYVVKQGDTPQKISQRFYGTPDHAADVLRANRLSWHTVQIRPGTKLVIPALASTTALV